MNDPQDKTKPKRGLLEQAAADEREHQFYSRALGWVIGLLLVAIGVLGFVAADGQAPEHPDCRLKAGALPPAIQPLALEMALGPAQVAEMLRGGPLAHYPAEPKYAEAMCIEARVARHRDVLELDSALFIPLYVALGLTALCWHIALAWRTQGTSPLPRGQVRRSLVLACLASAACLMLTAALDARENNRAFDVLNQAVGQQALKPEAMAAWASQVTAARSASIHKWLAAAAWACTLAMLMVLHLRSGGAGQGSVKRQRWQRALAWLALLSAGLAAGGLAVGAGLAGYAPSPDTQPWVLCLLRSGFALVLLHGLLLLAAHLLSLPPAEPPPTTNEEPVVAMMAPAHLGRREALDQ